MLTKGAFGNLVNRYRAVLKKCNLINTFGSLAVASMLVLGGAGVASAAEGNLVYSAGTEVADAITESAINGEYAADQRGVIVINSAPVNFKSTVYTQAEGTLSKTAYSQAAPAVTAIRINESAVTFAKGVEASAEDTKDVQTVGIFITNNDNNSSQKITAFKEAVSSAATSASGEAYAMAVSAGKVKADMQGASVTLTASSSNSNAYALSVANAVAATSENTVAMLKATANNGIATGIEVAGGDVSFAGPTTIEATGKDAYGINAFKYNGLAPKFTLSGNTSITATASSSTAYAVYNQSSTASVIGASDMSSVINLTATNTGTGTARSLRNEYGTITLNGDITTNAQSNSGFAMGLDNRLGGTLTVNGSSLNITAGSTAYGACGIQTAGAETFINSDNVTITASAEDYQVYGIDTLVNGRTSFAGDVTVNIFANNIPPSKESFVGGVYVNEGVTTFDKGLNVTITDTSTAGGDSSHGLHAVGNNEDSTSANNKISVAGHTNITVNTKSRDSIGIVTGCKAVVDLKSATITTSSSGSAYGVFASGNSNVNIKGNATIQTTAKTDAYAIFVDTEHGGGNFSLTGAENSITATSTDDHAYAVYMKGGTGVIGSSSSTSTLNGDVFVSEGASLTLNGTVNLNGVLTNNAADNAGTTVTEGVSGDATVVFSENAKVEGSAAVASTLKAKASSELNDKLGGNVEQFKEQIGGLTFAGMDEGLIAGAVDANGNQETNTVMQDTLDMVTAAPLAIGRIVMNDVRKRMGDLRDTKEESGVWMRWEGGKLKGDAGLTNNFNTIQIGADTMTGIENVRAGVAAAFTHGDLDHNNGEGENETYSFSAYATWMAENGMFADVIARVGFSNSEVSMKNTRIDLDNEALSLSGEYGWRLPVCEQFYVEPQVELTYTYVTGADSKVQYATYDVDSMDSLIGRAGLVAGWKLPSDMGSVYARASVVHEFLGDAKITGSALGNSIDLETDGKDTWIEYGIGANVKLTDKTYIWADVERTSGADIDEEWRGTVGIRYSF